MRGQSAKGRLFVLPHEAAVAEDIGTEYGGELAFQYPPIVARLSRPALTDVKAVNCVGGCAASAHNLRQAARAGVSGYALILLGHLIVNHDIASRSGGSERYGGMLVLEVPHLHGHGPNDRRHYAVNPPGASLKTEYLPKFHV